MIYREWKSDIIEDSIASIGQDLPLAYSATGGAVEYRKALAASFFFKFFMKVQSDLKKEVNMIDFI